MLNLFNATAEVCRCGASLGVNTLDRRQGPESEVVRGPRNRVNEMERLPLWTTPASAGPGRPLLTNASPA